MYPRTLDKYPHINKALRKAIIKGSQLQNQANKTR